jgi:hypothetical protein
VSLDEELVYELKVVRRSDTAKPIKIRMIEYDKKGGITQICELLSEEEPQLMHNAIRRLSRLVLGAK